MEQYLKNSYTNERYTTQNKKKTRPTKLSADDDNFKFVNTMYIIDILYVPTRLYK